MMWIFDIICIAFGLLSITTTVILLIYNRKKTEAMMLRVNKMLQEAQDGTFLEDAYDESVLSAIETRMNNFLSECAVSGRNLSSEKEKIQTLISDISHQTKTPIANILLYSQLLGEKDIPSDCKSFVTELSAQAEKLNFLIGALVKTSRLETGIIQLVPRKNQVAELIQSVIDQAQAKAQAKDISFSYPQECPINAVFDLKWTTEALYNIVDNAIKYTPIAGNISIKVNATDMFCRIDIADTGIGIDESEHAKIFSRFYRSTAVSELPGVGIGLFLSREIISSENGYIKLASALGEGSIFSVFIPLCAASPQSSVLQTDGM